MSGSTIDMQNTPSLTGCFCVYSAAVLAVLLLVAILVTVLVLTTVLVLGFVLIIHGTTSTMIFVRLSRKDRMPEFLGFILGLKYNAGYQSGKNGSSDPACGGFQSTREDS